MDNVLAGAAALVGGFLLIKKGLGKKNKENDQQSRSGRQTGGSSQVDKIPMPAAVALVGAAAVFAGAKVLRIGQEKKSIEKGSEQLTENHKNSGEGEHAQELDKAKTAEKVQMEALDWAEGESENDALKKDKSSQASAESEKASKTKIAAGSENMTGGQRALDEGKKETDEKAVAANTEVGGFLPVGAETEGKVAYANGEAEEGEVGDEMEGAKKRPRSIKSDAQGEEVESEADDGDWVKVEPRRRKEWKGPVEDEAEEKKGSEGVGLGFYAPLVQAASKEVAMEVLGGEEEVAILDEKPDVGGLKAGEKESIEQLGTLGGQQREDTKDSEGNAHVDDVSGSGGDIRTGNQQTEEAELTAGKPSSYTEGPEERDIVEETDDQGKDDKAAKPNLESNHAEESDDGHLVPVSPKIDAAQSDVQGVTANESGAQAGPTSSGKDLGFQSLPEEDSLEELGAHIVTKIEEVGVVEDVDSAAKFGFGAFTALTQEEVTEAQADVVGEEEVGEVVLGSGKLEDREEEGPTVDDVAAEQVEMSDVAAERVNDVKEEIVDAVTAGKGIEVSVDKGDVSAERGNDVLEEEKVDDVSAKKGDDKTTNDVNLEASGVASGAALADNSQAREPKDVELKDLPDSVISSIPSNDEEVDEEKAASECAARLGFGPFTALIDEEVKEAQSDVVGEEEVGNGQTGSKGEGNTETSEAALGVNDATLEKEGEAVGVAGVPEGKGGERLRGVIERENGNPGSRHADILELEGTESGKSESKEGGAADVETSSESTEELKENASYSETAPNSATPQEDKNGVQNKMVDSADSALVPVTIPQADLASSQQLDPRAMELDLKKLGLQQVPGEPASYEQVKPSPVTDTLASPDQLSALPRPIAISRQNLTNLSSPGALLSPFHSAPASPFHGSSHSEGSDYHEGLEDFNVEGGEEGELKRVGRSSSSGSSSGLGNGAGRDHSPQTNVNKMLNEVTDEGTKEKTDIVQRGWKEANGNRNGNRNGNCVHDNRNDMPDLTFPSNTKGKGKSLNGVNSDNLDGNTTGASSQTDTRGNDGASSVRDLLSRAKASAKRVNNKHESVMMGVPTSSID